MRLSIMTDLKGTAGVFSFEKQTYTTDKANEAAMAWLTAEVNAAIDGALAAGVTDVLVDRLADPDEQGATHVGRIMWQADDVDGITFVRQGGWAKPGDFVRVRIDDNLDYDFHATGQA